MYAHIIISPSIRSDIRRVRHKRNPAYNIQLSRIQLVALALKSVLSEVEAMNTVFVLRSDFGDHCFAYTATVLLI